MGRVWQRLREDARVAGWMLSHGALITFWLLLFGIFLGHMRQRLGYLTAHRPIANDLPCKSPECDFSVFWPAGRLAREHAYHLLYTPGLFSRAADAMLRPGSHIQTFFYPPPTLLAVALVSHLPFEWGFFVWTATLLLLAAAVLRLARVPWGVILAGLFSPAGLWCLELGQFGIIGGALLVAGVVLSRRAPWRAGGLLAVLGLKPQLGLLVPALFWGQRNWRALCAFAAICAGLCLLTLLLFGWGVWAAYFTAGRGQSISVADVAFNPGTYQGWGVSVFWMARSLHAGLALAYAAQVLSALAAAALVWWIWRREGVEPLDAMALTVFLSLLATPYGYSDDMVAYSIALAWLVWRRGWRIGLLDVFFWFWPMLCIDVAAKTGILFTPLVVGLAAARTWHRAGLPLPHLPRRAAVLPRA